MKKTNSLKGSRVLSFSRKAKGVSIVELLVSVAIMGIAIAGISELLWANTAWLTSLHNKFDSFYAAKSFCNRVERDLNQSLCVVKDSTSDNLNLQVAPESSFDKNGFLTSVKTKVYWVEPDTEVGYENSYIVKTADSKLAPSTVVLRGLIGPKSLTDSKPRLFQYIDKDGNATDLATESTTMVHMNLEIRRNEFGKSAAQNDKSGIVFRYEVLLRNANLHRL
ncbi:MAG: prepilin-type N-terminal cleavage/methylation domain-containing protein [Candidatus Obscuribacter phosphatis]|uniref:Prepilin-type N-terminal cleavage/methylation domain-containing protein n=1 Tax=Candidatus Obscuribacter phosphatis TaxID=1906157 RepID=A0A8J7TMZ6_9BACT|nr:prepilin-type N-terminal cleavage/methylation domain-containing protein [Candidatus Obscuribacter phosphatis]